VLGPFCFQSEAFVSDVNLNSGAATIYGMYAYATYCLTGENRNFERFGQHGAQFGRFTPWNNVFWVPGGCGWGAWEVKARYSNLTLNQMNAGIYNDFTIGFNWYWCDRVRCLFDWIHPFTSEQAVFGDTSSDILAMRFDFNW
jgi:phosphate-selective porin OprO and OprP